MHRFTYKIFAALIGLLIIFSVSDKVIAQGFDPRSIPSLALWLRSDTGVTLNGSTVSQWQDISGNGYHCTQPTTSLQPLYVTNAPTINNYPALSFDGSNDVLTGVNIPHLGDSSISVFILADGNAQTSGNNGFFSTGTGLNPTTLWIYRRPSNNAFAVNNSSDAGVIYNNALPNTGFPYKVLTFYKRVSVVDSIYTNGVCGPSGYGAHASSYVSTSSYLIGKAANTLNGRIAEVLVYTGDLTYAQRKEVENYLYDRYAPPVSLGPDIVSNYSLCADTLNAGNGFVSYVWSTGDNGATAIVNTSGSYSVTATDIFGRVTSDTINVTFPAYKLTQHDTTICANALLSIATTLPNPALYSYIWSDLQTTPTIQTTQAGSYYAYITDSFNCSVYSDTLILITDTFANTVSLGADADKCTGNNITLQSPGSGWSSLQFLWSNGSTDSIIQATTSGNYIVSVTNSNGCLGIDTIQINILGAAPLTNFSGDTFCLGEIYNPHNATISADTSTIQSYYWDFGDNTFGNSMQNPTYEYLTPGTYTVSLTATTLGGCSKTATRTVVVNNLPVANFISQPIGCINNSYSFTDQSIPFGNNIIQQWLWGFGDNTTSTIQSPMHVYTVAGNYNPQLIVIDNNGCADTLIKNISVVSTSALPGPVELIAPVNDISISTNNVFFTWAASQNAIQYKLLIADNSQFTSPAVYSTTATSYTATLATQQIYFWKVRAYNICNDSVESAVQSISIFSPGNLPNLSLWLRSDSGIVKTGTAVSAWQDMSGHGYNCTQGTAASQPLYVNAAPSINNYPAISFDGTNDVLTGVNIPHIGDSSLSIFIVADGEAQTSGNDGFFATGININANTIWLCRRPASNAFAINNSSDAGVVLTNSLSNAGFPYKVLTFYKKISAVDSAYVNGTCGPGGYGTQASIFNNTGSYLIGKAANTLNGRIAEVLVYTGELTYVQRKQIEKYLYDRYAPPVNLGPDIKSSYSLCPVTLDAEPRFVKYVWSTGDTTNSSIHVANTGTYWVQATDIFGRVSSDTIKITLPYTGMNTSDTIICSHNTLILQPVLTSLPYTFTWSSGQNTPSISITQANSYIVTITDTSNCSIISNPVIIQIDSFSDVSLLPTDTIMCAGNTLKIASGNYNVVSALWSNGAQTPDIIINNAGSLSVFASDINGCTAYDTIDIDIKGVAPLTDFTFTNVCLGNASSFTDLSVAQLPDGIANWLWDFGDTTFAVNQNPTHTYSTLNSYAVTLTVLTDSGCSGTVTKNVQAYELPDASFTYPGVICAGSGSVFYDASTVPAGDNIANWKWTFDHTDVINTANASYAFPVQGAIDVQLVIITAKGCTDSITKKVQAFPPINANFNFTGLCMGDTTRFTDITPSYSIVGWQWNFDDNQPFSVKQNPVHKYQQPGTYNVTLRIVNAIGCVEYINKNVKVVNKPVAKFGNLITCEDGFYTPLDSSIVLNDTISVWKWTIGGFNYTGPTPRRYFADTGTYSVKVVVTTVSGCSDSTTRNVSVKPRPHAEFGITPLYGSAPVDITILNQTTGAISYAWDFGDQTFSNVQNPTHTYIYNNNFNITLTATSQYNCRATVSHPFSVAPTDLDLSVDEVEGSQTTLPDGTHLIRVIVSASNLGTRIITNARFYVSMGGVGLVAEDWEGTLYSGQILVDTFDAYFVAVPEKANSYICVLAKTVNNGETEITTENNQQCTGITGTIQLVGPLPNPARNNAMLGLILPKQGKVTIDIASVSGQYIVKGDELTLPEGRSDYTLPIGQMLAGEYFIRVWYNDNKVVTKFIVTK